MSTKTFKINSKELASKLTQAVSVINPTNTMPVLLVVLSACRTGVGKEVKGEGIVGLTRGLMYAGAKRVVMSLWSVEDEATAVLMAKFYQKLLKQGEPSAKALRAAQLEMWQHKQWQEPYYWAAFILQGEWN
ncbi:hypothetical protein NUACC21_05770 [Scytonema sp. NUACC21]